MTKIKPLMHITGAVWLLALHLPAGGQVLSRQLDSLFAATFPAGAPGAAVAMTVRGVPVFVKGYGLADMDTRSAVDPGTRFNIGSLTKQFTAYCVLRLAARKKLSLSDPLSVFFKGLHPLIGSITLRQLLTHSSGIPDHYGYTDTSGLRHATDRDVLAAVMKMDTLYFASGARYRYSNTGYCLLGSVIEKVSGMSYPSFLQQQVLRPLGMKQTIVWQEDRPIAHAARGYAAGSGGRFSRQEAAEGLFFSTEADGGLYTTVTDYAKWLLYLEHAKGESADLVRQQRMPQFPIAGSPGLSYGYGWFCYRGGPRLAAYHSGSNGGFRAFVFTLPALRYSVTIFCNQDGIDLEKLVNAVNQVTGTGNNSFVKIEQLVSFNYSSPNFAACSVIL